MQGEHRKIRGGPKEEREKARCLTYIHTVLKDGASRPEAFWLRAIQQDSVGADGNRENHTKLWLGLPAQEARDGRRKCLKIFCLLERNSRNKHS